MNFSRSSWKELACCCKLAESLRLGFSDIGAASEHDENYLDVASSDGTAIVKTRHHTMHFGDCNMHLDDH